MFLTGSRVILRQLEPNDYESYKEVRERCHDWLMPWEPTVDGVPIDTTSTKTNFVNRVNAFERGAQFDTAYGFGVFLHNGTFLGEVSIGSIIRGPFQTCILGYWIDEKYAGKGIIPESLSLVVDYCFYVLGFKRVEVAIVPRNKASIRVVEKLGFQFEGVSKEYIEVAGVREDHNRYVMTPTDWEKQPRIE